MMKLSPPGCLIRPRSSPPLPPTFVFAAAKYHGTRVSPKALRLSPAKGFPSHVEKKNPGLAFQCSAEPRHPSEGTPTLIQKQILDFCFWRGGLPDEGFGWCFYGVTVVASSYFSFIVVGKYAIDLFPYPWFLSAIYHAYGFLCMVANWLNGIYLAPETDLGFWKSIFPVAVAHTVGHVATLVSLSKSTVSFTEIMRCGEAVFRVLMMALFLRGKALPLSVYFSLLPIIGGCVLAAITESNLSMTGFMAAMIANLAFASMTILSERIKNKGKFVEGPNYGACLSILSFFIISPFALAIEGPGLWIGGLKKAALHLTASKLFLLMLWQGVVYGAHIEVVYESFPLMRPFSFLSVNTLRKIFLIVYSIIFLKPVKPINALAAAITTLGIILHSRELCKVFRLPSCNLPSWNL